MRIYLSNESYPELRHMPVGWARSSTWWRAIAHAARHTHFWVFTGVQVVLVAGFLVADGLTIVVSGLGQTGNAVAHVAYGMAAIGVFGYLQVSWGGDMMRRHLRAVSEEARYACPFCGQSLYAHVVGRSDEAMERRSDEGGAIRCPECAARVKRAVFTEPYLIPPECRVFPPWRRRETRPAEN